MRIATLIILFVVLIAALVGQAKPSLQVAQAAQADPAPHAPAYTSDGRLLPQPDYREWIYLSSGLDMSYLPRTGAMAGHSMFDNLFVNPEAYRSFQQTGTWPDKTMLLLEVRGAESNASINKSGHFQGEGVMGIEAHIKDASHGGWAFYEFDGDAPAKVVPQDASCYSCHRDHAAVDTTFVQFYPTLKPLAKQKGTLSANYLKEDAQATK